MDEPEGYEPRPRFPRWAVALAALVLLAPLGTYVVSLTRGTDPAPPGPGVRRGTVAPEDPFDRTPSDAYCPTEMELEGGTETSLERQIDATERAVERLRKLRFEASLAVTVLAPDEVAARINDSQLAGYSEREIERDTRLLEILGLIPEGTDLEDLLQSLAGQVVGYYDPDTEELVVSATTQEEPLSPASELTLAHELEHALADSAFGLPIDDDVAPARSDASLARRALVEGDASLLTRHYLFAVLTAEQAGDITGDQVTRDALRDAAEIPPAIRTLFEFPYTHGLAFTCALYGDGGWRAVNEAYRRPPSTTAQVLFPERYRAREGAEDVRPLRALERPWTKLGGSALGASDLLALFTAPGGELSRALDDPAAAAAGWAGGMVEVWANGDRSAAGVALVEREPQDELCAAIEAWYQVAFPASEVAHYGTSKGMIAEERGRVAVLRCAGAEVRLGIGPDTRTANALSR
ncbi:MAG: hypothetical protein ACRDLB_15720 [Actinomycetota bacterium]